MKNISWETLGGQWEHEDASAMLFDHMIDKYNIDPEEDEIDPKLVSRICKGEMNKSEGDEKGWMFEIVANKENSFDVDKLDYLSRDNYHVGLNSQGNQDKINFE